jgi:hypothetical protein
MTRPPIATDDPFLARNESDLHRTLYRIMEDKGAIPPLVP